MLMDPNIKNYFFNLSISHACQALTQECYKSLWLLPSKCVLYNLMQKGAVGVDLLQQLKS